MWFNFEWFKKKQIDNRESDLKEYVRQRDEHFQELIPTLTYREKIEMAIEITKNSVCCGPALQMVNTLVLGLLERELEVILNESGIW